MDVRARLGLDGLMRLSTRLPPIPLRGPRPLPLLGVWGNLLRFMGDPVGHMLRIYREHGRLATLADRNAALICAFDPDVNRLVLSDQNRFHVSEELVFPVPKGSSMGRLSTNLTLLNGEAHRRHRRLMMPAFQRSAVETYRDDMATVTERHIERWRPGQALELAQEMQQLTLTFAVKCLFGLDASLGGADLGALSTELLGGLMSLGVAAFPHDLPGTPYRRTLRVAEVLEERLRRLIAQKRAQPAGSRDVLSMLIQAHDEQDGRFSDEELLGAANVLFIAGHETTAYTLTWTLFLLSQHPRVLADVLDEVSGELRGAAPTVEQVPRLVLLDRVVKESMRLLPASVMLFFRFATEPFQLGGLELQKGTGLLLSPLVTHRLPELYPEPERFRPERWLERQPSTYEFLPFGAGPRMCIGASFATLAVRVVLPILLQRFRFALAPGARISRHVRGITIAPRYGMPMIVGTPGEAGEPGTVRGDIHELVQLG